MGMPCLGMIMGRVWVGYLNPRPHTHQKLSSPYPYPYPYPGMNINPHTHTLWVPLYPYPNPYPKKLKKNTIFLTLFYIIGGNGQPLPLEEWLAIGELPSSFNKSIVCLSSIYEKIPSLKINQMKAKKFSFHSHTKLWTDLNMNIEAKARIREWTKKLHHSSKIRTFYY